MILRTGSSVWQIFYVLFYGPANMDFQGKKLKSTCVFMDEIKEANFNISFFIYIFYIYIFHMLG